MIGTIERLGRRILMLVGRGRVTAVNDAGAVQFVQVQLGADEIRDRTPRLAEFGFASNPPAGSDAVLVFAGGERASGVVIATGNQQYRMKGLATGEVAIYDSRGQSVYLTANGIVVNGGGNPVNIQNTSGVNVTTTGGAPQGVVQAGCMCAYTGQPHPQVSATVKASI